MNAEAVRGKVAIITGASSGIGRSIALELAAAGASCVLAARRTEALEAVAKECRGVGGEALVIKTDVSSREDCIRLIGDTTAATGRVDILVNNAGFAIFDHAADAAPEDLHAMMETNFFGAVHCTQAVLPQMLERRSGSIVNIASIAGIMGFARMGGYCATKFAMIGWSEALQNEVRSRGVNVSIICPGTTDTEFFQRAERGKMPAASRLMLAIPPERIARASIRAIRSGKARTIVPATAALFMKLKEITPSAAHGLMRQVSRWMEKE